MHRLLLSASFFITIGLLLPQNSMGQNKTVQSVEEAFRAQSIDRPTKIMYQLYAGIQPSSVPAAFQASGLQNHPIKCATSYVREYRQYKNEFSAASVRQVELMIGNAAQQAQQYQSASGRFTIFYETSGDDAVPAADSNGNAIPDYVEWTAAAADSSWRHQVQTLGYSNPVVGSTDPYPIYIEDLGASGFYGFTSTGGNRGFENSTYVVINSQLDQPAFTQNDHPNPAEGAVNVTVAHELKHAVQYANSQWYEGIDDSPHDIGWAEMDATYMEEAVYDNVNDYYNYINGNLSIFNDVDHSLPATYAGVSWSIYFEEDFAPAFWTDVWARIKQRYQAEQNQPNPNFLSMPDAVAATLTEDYDDNFAAAYTRSHLWHFASGPALSAPDFGFSERENYPAPAINFNLAGRDSIATDTVLPALAANYIQVDGTPTVPGNATITLNTADSFITLGVLAYFTDGSTEFKTYLPGQNTITANTGWAWERIQMMGVVVTNTSTGASTSYTLTVDATIPDEILFDANYPNPFTDRTTIPLSLPEDAHIQVKVFDTTGRLVETLADEERSAGRNPITFEAGSLASGIYFVQVIINGEAYVQKMTLIK